ncbi:PaaI family thioesterase [Salinisphaera sp. P385]|uniref:PaaI family thioesterase n=2 Tax=Spectribacter acetivorans TaxID=3075603 RepID=A0ABU3B7E9_9GAMM|nr:PaaI family thioesterase [Salinisphaera sp. P385]MDT0618387.1 PaaI family thioesterase [Salinisphaera sp. P385]
MSGTTPGQSMPLEYGTDTNTRAAWRTLLARIPYARHLGLEIGQHRTGIELHLPYREALIGNIMLPALHGGVLGALIEITARVAAQSQDAAGRRPRILDCDIDYLRSARAQSTFASAEIVRQGRRTSLVQVTCRQDGTRAPIARGRVQLLFGAPVDNQEIDNDA